MIALARERGLKKAKVGYATVMVLGGLVLLNLLSAAYDRVVFWYDAVAARGARIVILCFLIAALLWTPDGTLGIRFGRTFVTLARPINHLLHRAGYKKKSRGFADMQFANIVSRLICKFTEFSFA